MGAAEVVVPAPFEEEPFWLEEPAADVPGLVLAAALAVVVPGRGLNGLREVPRW